MSSSSTRVVPSDETPRDRMAVNYNLVIWLLLLALVTVVLMVGVFTTTEIQPQPIQPERALATDSLM